jgi:hypothetical protein
MNHYDRDALVDAIQLDQLKRREFISLLSGAAAGWPLPTRAQGSMPVIGYLSSFPANTNPKFSQEFRQGLNDAGFAEGRNVTIEYRWAAPLPASGWLEDRKRRTR